MHHKLQPHKSFTNNINTVLKKFFFRLLIHPVNAFEHTGRFLRRRRCGRRFLGNGKTHKQGSGLSLGIFVISLTSGELCRFMA